MSQNFTHLLQKCKTLKALKTIHSHLITTASIAASDLLLNKILRLYSGFRAVSQARKVFDGIPQPNPFLWTSMIHGYVENFQYNEAFTLFLCMQNEAAPPLNFTIVSILKGLGREKRVRDGEGVYGFAVKYGLGFDLLVENASIDLFMRCGKVELAQRVFDGMKEKDVVSWNSMISGYGSNGRVEAALALFNSMPERNVVSWTGMISGYVKIGDMGEAQRLFEAMPVKDSAVGNVMVSGYLDVGDVDMARIMFDMMPVRGVGTWNLMISGFVKAGNLEMAEVYFDKMPMRNVASWTIMIDGYVNAGNLTEARRLFDQMPEKNLVSWSVMIGGYAKNGQPRAALRLFEGFKKQGIKPDETLILDIISACCQLGIVNAVESIINDSEGSLAANPRVVTSLIDMYAKCGSIEKASQIFERADNKDLLCYSTMLAAFANHGLVQEAISLFYNMQTENITPDGVTFLGILTACNHAGFVNEGRRYFKQMIEELKIEPTNKHYACMVDLLGRAGHLEEAHNLINEMRVPCTSVVWGALLAACKVHKNVQLAEIAAAELFKIEPENSGNYILLSNTYADAGRWSDVSKIRAVIRENRVKKNRGSSWIELETIMHEFAMGDLSHSDSDRIYFMLDLLNEDMKLPGYLISAKNEELTEVLF